MHHEEKGEKITPYSVVLPPPPSLPPHLPTRSPSPQHERGTILFSTHLLAACSMVIVLLSKWAPRGKNRGQVGNISPLLALLCHFVGGSTILR
ncbi:hypothetical protein T484DRAFT_3193038 [Baffinella frigidus]|nr:hypothetical protein T484DRAFT_3193038 [Cryptophyta sp. CCMP2293]